MPESPSLKAAVPILPQKSGGGLYLAAGCVLLLVSVGLAAVPGEYWVAFLMSFAFSFYGLLRAKGLVRKIIGMALSGVCGGLLLNDFLIWWNKH